MPASRPDQIMQEIFSTLAQHPGAMALSFSRVNLLLNICPFQWKCRYEDRLKAAVPPSDPAMEAGKAIHKVLEEAVNRSRLHNYEEGREDFAYFLESAVNASSSEVGALVSSMGASTKEVLEKVLSVVRKHKAQTYTERRLLLSKVGKPMDYFRTWNDVGWIGYVDLELITKPKMIILDYKSEHFTEEREKSVKGQTAMYAYMEFQRYPDLQKIQTGCAYLKDGKIVMDETIKRDELPEIKDSLLELYARYLEAVVSGDREPRASKYCAWCGYTNLCPLKK